MNTPLVRWLAFAFGVFHLYTNVFATMSELWFSAIHFGGFGALCALSFQDPEQYAARVSWQRVLGVTLAILSAATAVYLILFEDALYARGTEFVLSDYLACGIAILLAIEFTRRVAGWFLPVLIVFSLCYMLFLGRYVSGIFSFPGLSFETVLYRSYFSSSGMFGFVANISATYIFMFILFGSFLLKSGAGDFIIKLARSVGDRFVGGAGMVAVVGSGLMGSVTGSAVANTVSTGTITIPMMKRAGFRPQFAAAVEAAASTGGQLMPPVMGAGAFIMASYTQIPYTQIVAVSVLPAILYFLTVIFFVRGEAKRSGWSADHDADTPGAASLLLKEWYFIVPLLVLIGGLVLGFTPIRSVTFAIVAVILCSWMSPQPMTPARCFDAVVDAMRTMTATAVLLVAIGLVINVVTTTGVGNAFSLMIVDWAGGSLIVTLILIALASLILGMGLPVTAAYVVLATLTAPMLLDLISHDALLKLLRAGELPTSVQATLDLFGGDPRIALQEMPLQMKELVMRQLLDPALLTSMILSAHLVIFWLSQDSNVTPPVCLTAFAAAGIAGTRPMATGLTTWKLAKGLYLVPLLFVYTPLITGDWLDRFEIFVWSCFGLYGLCGLLQWHLEKPLSAITAAVVIICVVLLLWPPFGFVLHLTGAGILVGLVLLQGRDSRSKKKGAIQAP